MRNPSISVIMPAYNHQKYVGAAIESVLAQTFTDFEFIIIDDGSTDSTAKVIEGYKDEGIISIRQPNSDAYNAINRALAMTKGDLIAILNSDDLFDVRRLELLRQKAQDTSAVFFFSGIEFINEKTIALPDGDKRTLGYKRLEKIYQDTGSLLKVFFFGNFAITTSNFFFRRTVYERVGDFHPYRYAHDYDYLLRVLKEFGQEGISMLPEKLIRYRFHGSNTLNEKKSIVIKETYEIVARHFSGFLHCQEDIALIESILLPVLVHSGDKFAEIISTRSWRITQPLRTIAEWFEGKWCR